MTNAQIAETFELLADLIEFQGANAFRVRAYRNAARTIRDYPESIASLVEEDGKRLAAIEGIGDSSAKKCIELIETGELSQLNELRAQVPESVLAMLRIPGLGPKKAAALFKELHVATLDELRAVCQAGKVRELKGFGEKTEQTILAGIDLAATANQRIYWADADEIAHALRDHLGACRSVRQLELAGSYRRGRETVGDLDVLVDSSDVAEVMDRFAEFPGVASVLGRGDTKMSVRLDTGLQIDLRVVPAESFGAALQYFTGSKDHNVVLRGMAKQRGLKINEYGVFRVDGPGDASRGTGGKGGTSGKKEDESGVRIAGATEEEVYAAIGVPCFPPELREARREFEWAEQGDLPRLVELDDLCADLHMHTTATDGKATLDEMIAAARNRGLKYIAITDHSQRVSMARGMNGERLLAQWREIDEKNDALAGEFLVLKGIECDILEKGGMDLPDEILAQADWVIASVHYGQKQPREQITARIVGAIENPHVDIVAHPTGRLLNRREPYEVNMDEVFAAAREHGKLLELNANPARLDLNDVQCAAAKSHGIPIVISSDAHSVDGLDVLRFGVLQARRGGLTRADVANTRDWPQLRKLIGQRRFAK